MHEVGSAARRHAQQKALVDASGGGTFKRRDPTEESAGRPLVIGVFSRPSVAPAELPRCKLQKTSRRGGKIITAAV